MKAKKFIIGLTVLLLLSSCYKNDPIVMTDEEINNNMNQWIYDIMKYYYYWEKEIPDNIQKCNVNSKDFFKSLLYVNDEFSDIFIQDLSDQSISLKKNFGFESVFGYIDENKKNVGGLVLYVFPNSAAEIQGVKRGDIFTAIDSISLTKENVDELFLKNRVTFSFVRENNNNYETFVRVLTQENHEIHPIQMQKIINIGDTRIGYLCYNRFLNDNGNGSSRYVDQLLECFSNFKRHNINEIIIDLRYNPGGLINLSVLLASLIVPDVDTTKVALYSEYNDNINKILNSNNGWASLHFSLNPESYIGNSINRVFFIVGSMTASASEAVINALLPYMEVILIGEKTYGKNYGSILFSNNSTLKNACSIMPIVLKSYNSNYESNYADGFIPDHQINEFMYPLYELGDTRETMLNYILTSIISVHSGYENKISKRINSFYTFCPLSNVLIDNAIIYEIVDHEK